MVLCTTTTNDIVVCTVTAPQAPPRHASSAAVVERADAAAGGAGTSGNGLAAPRERTPLPSRSNRWLDARTRLLEEMRSSTTQSSLDTKQVILLLPIFLCGQSIQQMINKQKPNVHEENKPYS